MTPPKGRSTVTDSADPTVDDGTPEPVSKGKTKCANHPDRDAVVTTPADAGFAPTSFCAECVKRLPETLRG